MITYGVLDLELQTSDQTASVAGRVKEKSAKLSGGRFCEYWTAPNIHIGKYFNDEGHIPSPTTSKQNARKLMPVTS